MLGFLLIYFIGNSFYKLAVEFGKHKWGFAILGVVTYYGSGVLLITIGMIILMYLGSNSSFESVPSWGWDLLGIPIGLAACYGLHAFLKYQWTKSTKGTTTEVLDADLMK
jgi:hypothetical protein